MTARALTTLAALLALGIVRADPLEVLPGPPPPPPSVTIDEARAAADDAVEALIILHNTQADRYFHEGEFLRTVDMLDRTIELDPTDFEPYALAGWVLWGRDPERAQAYYARMIAAAPTNPKAYFEVGQFWFINQRDYVKAAEWLGKAVELGLPINDEKGHLYGHALVKAGREGLARPFWARCLAADPNDAVAKRELEQLTPAANPG